MRYFTFDLNGNEINMRLNSSSCEQIEKTYNCTLVDYVQQGSITSIITLLQHMRAGADAKFTKNMAHGFFDELVDEGYTIEKILMEIVYPTLVISGVLSQEDFDAIKEDLNKIKDMTDEEKEEMIAKRKNLQK